MGEAFIIVIVVLFGLGLPATVVALNVVSLMPRGRRGLNVKCSVAALLFGLSLTVGFGTFPLFKIGNDYVKFTILSTAAALCVLSALVALLGMYEIRRRPSRWPRGWKRGIWAFWLSLFFLAAYSGFYYLATHDDLFDRFYRFLT